ncbi:MAG: hypothetical protein M1830_004790 [Pleopsidium flavum]|nr:MAG: hypothetical protein M1830_004790 [Pleopsidium flavum]
MSTLSYGLNITKKVPSLANRPAPAKRKTIFDDDSGPEDGPETADGAEEIGVIGGLTSKINSERSQHNASNTKTAVANTKQKSLISQYGDLSASHTSKKHADEATSVDASVYDYDAVYDSLHAPSNSKSSPTNADRKPRYMGNLLAAAEVRKRDQLRAKEKMLLKEREAEGDEFADKEKFVTEAYKAQQEEVKRLEEEEARKEAEEARKGKGQGMVGFYKSVLDRDEKKHEEAVRAAEGAKVMDGSKEEEDVGEKEKSEVEIARDLNAQGKGVIVNDEGQIVDKRQLLSAGLNIAPKPKSTSSSINFSSNATSRPNAENHFQGRGGSKQAMRERQTRMMEAQLEQVTKRAADDEEDQRRELERAAKSRKTDGEITSARERYLQRKREAVAGTAP